MPKLILALLFINRGHPLNNSYKLMRILEWNFHTLDSNEILDKIKEENYAQFEVINAVHYYTLP